MYFEGFTGLLHKALKVNDYFEPAMPLGKMTAECGSPASLRELQVLQYAHAKQNFVIVHARAYVSRCAHEAKCPDVQRSIVVARPTTVPLAVETRELTPAVRPSRRLK